MNIAKIKEAIRDIPDFPKKGIVFKDITPVLGNRAVFKAVIDIFSKRLAEKKVEKIAAIDARGFIFGGAVADRLGIGIVPIRKKGKLPYKTFDESYDLEYGSATISVHQDAFKKGERVAVMDDLLATGGTASAAVKLVEKCGGVVVDIVFLIELSFLGGRGKLRGYDVFAPIVFDKE